MRKTSVILVVLTLSLIGARANNLSITNVALNNAGGGGVDVAFDISWDNSWYETWTDRGGAVTITNWDAAWVFAKFRQSGGGWKHMKFEASGHAPSGGLTTTPSTDSLGVFLHRSTAGSGSIAAPASTLRWNYAAAGLTSTNELDIAVYGIEMVYIPEGAYELGSGGTEANHFYTVPDETTTYTISNENELIYGDLDGNLRATGLSGSYTVPTEYPKGFQAFYCMKYECSQGQYTVFLNALDPAEAAKYYSNADGSYRHTITKTNGVYLAEAPNLACNRLLGDDIFAYLDWSGLRPMTEFEYEKACRGARAAYINEMAWGDTTYVYQTGIDGSDLSGTETALPTNANINASRVLGGSMRCGIFATTASSRQAAGAAYYGVMEMSGNLWEFTLTPFTSVSSINFMGSHGDGNEYTAPPVNWPRNHGRGNRGGSFYDTVPNNL